MSLFLFPFKHSLKPYINPTQSLKPLTHIKLLPTAKTLKIGFKINSKDIDIIILIVYN